MSSSSSPGLHQPVRPRSPAQLAVVTLAALGVVYGDIGTSPLYALRECFYGPHGDRGHREPTCSACSR